MGEGALELLAERIRDYRAQVRLVRAEEIPNAVAKALRARNARRIVVPPGFPAEWLASGECEWLSDEGPLTPAELDRVDGVITSCVVAIAETGTLVLDGGTGQGRRALTLIPDYHLCVVPVGRVVRTVAEAMPLLDPIRPLTWISGPSATSDIELDRVEGVHGPRTLEVIVVG
ncbi:LutC/YkgG family protein [Rhizohabitans arisaemae]|uniref:LutC/YkgG family protein n=1 Tax=Rhizohabitans arisaemae TaxID=2720610 RepID=UPI0024B048F3|nr:LUD domain-containing protein [Rhizohabitans arisaemae]